jgi:hypothetical protein
LGAGAFNERVPALEEIGGAWNRKHVVEIAGLNRPQHVLALGVCLWQDEAVGPEPLRRLISQAASVVPKNGSWKVHFFGFASQGWTNEAQAYANAVRQAGDSGRNWHPVDVYLLDLAQINADLIRWSVPVYPASNGSD